MTPAKYPYRYETHMHTSESSQCGKSSGADMAWAYAKAGYSGIIVTDHFFNGNSAAPVDAPWAERVAVLCAGYESAAQAGRELGLAVFLGWEYCYRGTEFLTYGLDADFLCDHPDLLDWDVTTYLDRARQAGAFISQAHPFRQMSHLEHIRLYHRHVDAMEIVNFNVDAGCDHLARTFVEANDQLAFTAGSDRHDVANERLSGMAFGHRLESSADFIQAVRAREGVAIGRDGECLSAEDLRSK